MVGETLNAPPISQPVAPEQGRVLPKHLLYSIFARIGGSGLDTDAFETLRASHRGGFLGRAIAYDNRQSEIPAPLIYLLRWHSVRLISFLDPPDYYGGEEKLYSLPGGVDVARFKPGPRPPIFRAVFSGALIERKGIHHVLEAWHRLDLKDAELWLVGSVHDEARPHLKKFWRDNIKVVGFKRDVENYLSQGTIHVFPSTCEGSAKVVYEAAACGLPQITTREAGDVVNDGVEGIIIQPGNVGELAAAILELYRHPETVEQMSEAARLRVVDNFTWDHFRTRLLIAYEKAMRMKR